ncbi:MAG: hypothetical protein K9J13_00285 [Saprospiraceae bacterium]|nr:hypothetical protein [Saprospiraceae bacterium]
MGGEGSMLAMIQSLRNNKKILRQRRFFNKDKDELRYSSKKINSKYKLKATKDELYTIKTQLEKERKHNVIKTLIALIISISVGFILFYFLYLKYY